ncbi:MAG: DNA gyrase subunit A, partial [Muribaculaceae bacterium]|nr:DNA gyrase subunit A [Muribaculaceae bacterium]
RAQNRGGVGARGSKTRDTDFIEHIYTANMRSTMLFFTDKGLVYKLHVYELPARDKNNQGRALQNLLNIEPGDKVRAFISCSHLNDAEFTSSHYLVFATKNGLIKKTLLSEYARVMAKGKKAIVLREGDTLVGVELTDGNCEILMANRHGRAIRFHENGLRAMGRVSAGVRGMRIDEDSDDAVIGLITMPENTENNVMVLSAKGFGKRSKLEDYRITNRGARGVKTLNVTDKTGELVGFMSVNDENDLVIINRSGVVLRFHVADIRVMGRYTQGVRIINLAKRNDAIASVCVVDSDPETEVEQVAPDAEELPELGAEPDEIETEEVEEVEEVEEEDSDDIADNE